MQHEAKTLSGWTIGMLVSLLIGGLLLGQPLLAQKSASVPELLTPIPDKDHGVHCNGDILLDQGPNLSFSLWSEATCENCGTEAKAQVLADDFTLSRPSFVTEVVIWGWYFPNNTAPETETWTLIFHNDGGNETGNVPGDVLATEVAVPISRTPTGRTTNILGVDVDEYRWVMKLETPVHLPSVGPFYWIEAIHDSPDAFADTSIGHADLDETRGSVGIAQSFTAPGAEWAYFEPADNAIQICGVSAELNGLMLPGYKIDINDPTGDTAFLAVRNSSGEARTLNVSYYNDTINTGSVRVDTIDLGPNQTYTQNLRSNLSGLDPDEDGTAQGFVVVTDQLGGHDNLTGDVLRVDFANDFATGERLVALDDFCQRQEIRYVDFGSGTSFNVMLLDPQDGETDFFVEVFNEAGGSLGAFSANFSRQVAPFVISDLTEESFGTLVFDFGASGGGLVTARYSAFGRFSTELRGSCLD